MSEIAYSKSKKLYLRLKPQEWTAPHLKHLFTIKHGFAFKSDQFSAEGTFIVTTPGHFHPEGGFRSRSGSEKRYIGSFPEEYILRKGDLVIAMTEQGPGLLGSTAEIPKDNLYLHNQRLGLVENLDEDRLDKKYLYFSLNSQPLRNSIAREAAGTKVKHTSPKKILDLQIPLPPLPEQQKIATILSTWDRAIALTRQLLQEKEAQKKGLMQRLLKPKHSWEEYKYGDILKVVKRPVAWNDEALYDLISVRRRSGGLYYRESLYGHQIKTKNLSTAKKGDFLISKMQIVHGASGLTTTEFDGMKISGSYIAVISKNRQVLDIDFLNCLSKTPVFYHQTYISSYGVHIEKMTFDFKSFLKLKVKLPALTEQKQIVNILQTADSELDFLREKVAALQAQKKGLMQRLLTGKMRVNP